MKALFITTVLLMGIIVHTNCSGNSKKMKEESLWDETKTEVVAQDNPALENTADNDTTIFESGVATARLEDAINYFRQNNKYKDWAKDDERSVFVRGVVEKNGKLSHIVKIGGDENEELRAEAVRLLKEAYITPAKNDRGQNVRSYWVNVVHFPPK